MKKVLLCIMDGVGFRDESYGNAVKAANTKNLDMLLKKYPSSLLEASGTKVGLPEGQMGNSEVGHTNIGAGRIVYQPLEFISNQVKTKKIFDNENINKVLNHSRDNNSKLHILGLLSDGGIHSNINHLFSILELCKEKKLKDVYIHIFTDGRDTFPNSGVQFVEQLQNKIDKLGVGKIASISGRYYAMDRDNNWDRIKKAYDVIVNGLGRQVKDPIKYLRESYKKDITDEFIKPIVIDKSGIISNNDGLLVFNFRPDRLRELFMSITNPDFKEFNHKTLKNIKLVTMMPVSGDVICTNAFKLEKLDNTLGEYLSYNKVKQLRIAETEKYAHVTYFFDGGVEKKLKGCDRILIPSVKVATYDLKPEMSAYEITDELIGKLYKEAIKEDYTMVITADHGNSDYMLDDKGNVITSHSTSLVPFIVTDSKYKLKNGKLSDIAPTILKIMGLDIPNEMSGEILIK